MAAPSSKHRPVSFRFCKVIPIGTDGIPSAVDATVFEGSEFEGPQTLEMTLPGTRPIYHYSKSRVEAVDYLPPTEGVTGTLTISGVDYDIQATLTGQNVVTLGETKMFGMATDKQGEEALVSLLGYTQSLEENTGVRVWEHILIPAARLVRNARNYNDDPGTVQYTVYPQVVTSYPWGIAFTMGTEGYTEAQYSEGVSYYKPNLVAWQGDTSTTQFDFPTSKQAQATGKIKAWEWDGSSSTDITGTATLAVGSVTVSPAPVATDTIIAWYEYA